jgi:hypothetical protein
VIDSCAFDLSGLLVDGVIDGFRDFTGEAGHRKQRVTLRLADGPEASEMFEELGPSFLAYAGYVVERGRGSFFVAELPVMRYRETVRLVTGLRQQVDRG